MSANITNLDAATFDTTITGSTVPVLVDFWATWCGPCKAIAPVLEQLAEEMAGKVKVCKVDVDHNQALAGRFRVQAIPTLILFKGGQVVEQMQGLMSKEALKKKIASHQ